MNLVLFLIYSGLLFASPPISISLYPGTVLPTAIIKGQTAKVYYLVQNNTSVTQKNFRVQNLPPNVKQITHADVYPVCKEQFDLEPKSSSSDRPPSPSNCTLELLINGAVEANDIDPSHHVTICQYDGANCFGVTNKNEELNVVEGMKNSLARLAVVNLAYTQPDQGYLTTYKSVDNGISWEPHELVGAKGNFSAVSCHSNDGQHCTAIGNFGYFNGGSDTVTLYSHTSDDGGINWNSHYIAKFGATSGLAAISCNGKIGENCIAVGSYENIPTGGPTAPAAPIVYISADGGVSWLARHPAVADVPNKHSSFLRDVACGGTDGKYCTAIGIIYDQEVNPPRTELPTFISYTSKDGGMNWNGPYIIDKHKGNGSTEIEAVACNGDQGQYCKAVGYVAANDEVKERQSILYTSVDSGENWSSHIIGQPGESTDFNKIICNSGDGQHCLALGKVHSTSVLYVSADGGMSWKKEQVNNAGKNSELYSISCSGENGQYCTLVGKFRSNTGSKMYPLVYTSINGGDTWIKNSKGFSSFDEKLPEIQDAYVGVSGGN